MSLARDGVTQRRIRAIPSLPRHHWRSYRRRMRGGPMKTALRFSCVPLCGLICGIASPGHAQQYPVKPLRLIVPYPPGGTTDIVAREVTSRMGEGMGQQVLVDN